MSVREAAERKLNGIASVIPHDDIYGRGDEAGCNRILADAYLAISDLITPEVREAAERLGGRTFDYCPLKELALAVIERVGT